MKRTLVLVIGVFMMICAMSTASLALEIVEKKPEPKPVEATQAEAEGLQLIEIEPEVKIEDIMEPVPIAVYSEPSGKLELYQVTTRRSCYNVVKSLGMGKKYIVTDSQDTARRFVLAIKELAANEAEAKKYRLNAKFATAEELPPDLMPQIKTSKSGVYVITIQKVDLESIQAAKSGKPKNYTLPIILGLGAILGFAL